MSSSKLIRLHVTAPLAAQAVISASEDQAHYLLNVMRATPASEVILFNGRDGAWRASVGVPAKRRVEFTVTAQTQLPRREPDLWLAFAPVKRIEFLAEKASELGVAALLPVFTRHTDVSRVNVQRLKANATEAAEQCERLSVPDVHEPVTFDKLLAQWPSGRKLFVLDETGGGIPIASALRVAAAAPVGFLTGPEGGFAQTELDALRQLPFVTAVGLGPRILRAETAALAALACWQALQGDWVAKA